ncbi:hypothetical protein [Actinomadura sp. 6K520]|nr:hypothetical protein [Actinomadura sp. 6K520]
MAAAAFLQAAIDGVGGQRRQDEAFEGATLDRQVQGGVAEAGEGGTG